MCDINLFTFLDKNVFYKCWSLKIKYPSIYNIDARYDKEWININNDKKEIIVVPDNGNLSRFHILYICLLLSISAGDDNKHLSITDNRFKIIDDTNMILLYNP